MLTADRHAARERGSAMIAAIAVAIICAFIVLAVVINGMSSSSSSRATLDRASAEQLARQAGTALTSIYSMSRSGEFDGFVPSPASLAGYGTVENNPTALGEVDGSIRPADRRRSVCSDLQDGRMGCWQLFAVQNPIWGTTKAGAVTVYVRAWTRVGRAGALSAPMMFRMDVRPTWMSDYQAITDGKMYFARNAAVNGRVHSNGREASFFNQDRDYPDQIEFDPSATCGNVTRITTTTGTIKAPNASCVGKSYPDTRREINLLRASALAQQVRAVATLPPSERQMLRNVANVHNPAAPLTVRLDGTQIRTNMGHRLDARAHADSNGAILVATGDIDISGRLASGTRALVIAMRSPTQQGYTQGSAPSVTIRQSGEFGGFGDARSSFGIVADGDVILDTYRGGSCPIQVRGAFTAASGMMSIDRQVRVPFDVNDSNDYLCNGEATIRASTAEHLSGALFSAINNAGYARRDASYLESLFDNPPPMYPTAFDWQVVKFAPADLDCFDDRGVLDRTPTSGCVA